MVLYRVFPFKYYIHELVSLIQFMYELVLLVHVLLLLYVGLIDIWYCCSMIDIIPMWYYPYVIPMIPLCGNP